MITRQEYSTLELVENHGTLETVPQDSTLEAVYGQDNQPGLEIGTRIPSPNQSNGTNKEEAAKERGQKSTVYGIRSNTFRVIAIIVTLLVMAVIAGIVVGVKSKKGSKDTNSIPPPSPIQTLPPQPTIPTLPPQPTIPATNLLLNSSLASVNWTSGGLQYYGVFFQNKNNSIIMSLRDPISSTWTPSPIMVDNVYSPLPGTHIAATAHAPLNAVNITQLNLYLTSKNDELLEFWTQDPYAGTWKSGDLTDKEQRLTSIHGSQLAVHYWGCSPSIDTGPNASHDRECLNSPVLLYQTKSQGLRYANSTNTWSGANFLESVFEQGAVMAMMSLAPGGNDISRNTTSGQVAYIESAGNIVEYTWEGSKWANEGQFFKNKTPPKAPLAIAATTLQSTTTSRKPDLIVLGIYLEGGIRSPKIMVGTGSVWNDPVSPTMTKSMSNITAMATNFDRRFYGISEGQIHEYEFAIDPLSWIYRGIVSI
ncbi:hypothetical protein HYFRA_00007272 [Hymenoscyphus fraxineus]|uniref:Fucose-specific lectin n=1 Tax=Hymenoscyphus fraxineus TaxID=746836 RepID=A0A9N9KQN7_9HELO|nr:hypothetical protein HYFRA_00007272 [Hymenoscyphus fraxineus]